VKKIVAAILGFVLVLSPVSVFYVLAASSGSWDDGVGVKQISVDGETVLFVKNDGSL